MRLPDIRWAGLLPVWSLGFLIFNTGLVTRRKAWLPRGSVFVFLSLCAKQPGNATTRESEDPHPSLDPTAFLILG